MIVTKMNSAICLTSLALLFVLAPAALAQNYTFTDVGGITSGIGVSQATAINASHQVLGVGGPTSGSSTTDHAYLLNNGVWTDLGPLFPNSGDDMALNNLGQAATVGSNGHVFLYANGVNRDVGLLSGASNAETWGINDSGTIVGNLDPSSDGFMYANGTMTDLAVKTGAFVATLGINNSGQIVGATGATANASSFAACLYSNGTLTNLASQIGGTGSWAKGINNNGQIVGVYTPSGPPSTDASAGDHGFVLSNGVMTDLGTIAGGTTYEPWRINSSGQVVGWYKANGSVQHAFIYTNGKLQDLNTLVPTLPAGVVLSVATGISDDGYIVGVANMGNNLGNHAFLLTPTVTGTPVLATQPQNQSVGVGGTATFTVTASGTAPLTYQWQKNGTNISGATNATLTLSNVQSTSAGSYTVTVANTAGSATSTAATLTVTGPLSIATQPVNQTVNVGSAATFTVAASGTAPVNYQWTKDGTAISGATGANYSINSAQLSDGGLYAVTVTNSAGTVTSNNATLIVTPPAGSPPAVAVAPANQTVAPGNSAMFTAAVGSASALSYQWILNNTAIAGATNSTYTVPNVQSGSMGFYWVAVSNSAGTVNSAVAILTVPGGSSRLTAVSTRGAAGAGENALTPGIALRGSGNKTLVIRGVGPTLGSYGVAGTLSDPKLDVIPFGASTAVSSNDNWGTNTNVAALRTAMAAAGLFPLGEGSKDAAVLATLATPNTAGNNLYTVQVAPAGTAASWDPNAPPIALAEVYDTEGLTSPVRLNAISTRGFTGKGAAVLTPGFIISGDGAKQLLIRVVGPGLASYGVGGLLADPQLTVIPLGQNFSVASNDNWGGTAELQAAFAQTGAFALPTNSKDAAVVVRLPPGGYTVQATGVGDTAGNVLVEVYDMDP